MNNMPMFVYYILGLLVFIIVLMVIVAVHEGGHFLIAKKSGILCHEYSLGMGPALLHKKRKGGETAFSIRAFPIGGYVSMAGEDPEDDMLKGFTKCRLIIENEKVVKIILDLNNPKYREYPEFYILDYDLIGTEKCLDSELFITVTSDKIDESRIKELKDDENIQKLTYQVDRRCMVNVRKKEEIQIAPWDRSFNNKSWPKRFFSVLAGPLMNFVFAWLIFLLMGVFFGYADTSSTKIAEVQGPALEAGLENNDVIYSINDIELSDWFSLQVAMGEIATGTNLSNGASGITFDGKVTVKYYHQGDTNDLRTAIVTPQVYFASSDLIVKYDNEKSGVIIANSEAETKLEKAGLKQNDKIVKINDIDITGIDSILQFYSTQISEGTKELSFTVERDGVLNTDEHIVKIYTLSDLDANNYDPINVKLGVSTGSSFQFVKLLYMPFKQTGDASLQIIKTLRQLFRKNSSIGIRDLSGPVGIFNLFTRLVQGPDAMYNILYWTGLISVNLGIINLLPLPALDGGRIAFLIYEAITRKKPTPKVENTINTVGLIILLAFSVFIVISDIIKCF